MFFKHLQNEIFGIIFKFSTLAILEVIGLKYYDSCLISVILPNKKGLDPYLSSLDPAVGYFLGPTPYSRELIDGKFNMQAGYHPTGSG